jgi:hypothetical protein
MNNTFNIKRFGKLIRQQYQLSGKNTALAILSIFIVYTLILMSFTYKNSHIRAVEWIPFFFMLNLGVALPFAGYAFPAFRSKEKTFDYLLIPCSLTEKFTLNLIIRLLLPWVILPIIFYISAHLAAELALWYAPGRSIAAFSPIKLMEHLESDRARAMITVIVLMVLISQSILFAGATVFKQKPLIKTLVTLGITAAVVILYFYVIIEVADTFKTGKMPWVAKIENKETALNFLIGLELVLLTTTWAYAFFKVKEKELT